MLMLTGVFALMGALYAWGKGLIFTMKPGMESPILWGDLLVAAPLSLIAGVGLRRGKRWGMFLALAAAGVYIYGSVQVYVMILLQGAPYPLSLVIPPLFGLAIAAWVIQFCCKAHSCFE